MDSGVAESPYVGEMCDRDVFALVEGQVVVPRGRIGAFRFDGMHLVPGLGARLMCLGIDGRPLMRTNRLCSVVQGWLSNGAALYSDAGAYAKSVGEGGRA